MARLIDSLDIFNGFIFDRLLQNYLKCYQYYSKYSWNIGENVGNVPVLHEIDKCVPPLVFTYLLSF